AQRVDLGRGVAGAEAVVDVDDGDAAAATVEHPKQRRQAAETGAVTDAGGNGNHRRAHKAGNDAGQGAFHSGDHDDDIRALDRFEPVQQAVNAGNADVGDAFDAVAHDLGGDGRLFHDREVAGAGADDGDGARSFGQRFADDGDAAGEFMVN